MVTSNPYKHNIFKSSDSSEYIAVFHHQVLMLITEACDMIKATAEDYTNSDERDITREVVIRARQYIETPNSPEWVWHYSVHEDPPEDDKRRKVKERKKVDIIFERTQRGKHPRIRFEAKRLKNKSHPVGTYLGSEGLGEFVAGNYARKDKVAGMLGYVQSDDCGYWANQIAEKLKEKKIEVCLKNNSHWQKAGFEDINHCYKTRHDRPTVESDLLVFHLLLDFTN